MDKVELEFEIKPKFSQLSDDIEVYVKFPQIKEGESHTIHNPLPKSFICEAKFIIDIVHLKKEIEVYKEKAEMDPKQSNLSFKIIECGHLKSVHNDELLNVSVLEINIYNKSENFSYRKKMIVQFVKDKNILYKNIII